MNLADVIRILELVNQTLTTLKELGVNLNGVNAARVAYGVFQFGYDGTWPASWKVDQVKHFMPWARSVVGENAYLSMMFANGPSGSPYLYVEDESDYHKPWMQAWDCIQLSTQPIKLSRF